MKGNSKIINTFIIEKGISRGKLAELMKIDRKTLYDFIYKPTEKGLSATRKAQFNKVFKDYNFNEELV